MSLTDIDGQLSYQIYASFLSNCNCLPNDLNILILLHSINLIFLHKQEKRLLILFRLIISRTKSDSWTNDSALPP